MLTADEAWLRLKQAAAVVLLCPRGIVLDRFSERRGKGDRVCTGFAKRGVGDLAWGSHGDKGIDLGLLPPHGKAGPNDALIAVGTLISAGTLGGLWRQRQMADQGSRRGSTEQPARQGVATDGGGAYDEVCNWNKEWIR